jgi:Ser/Thr protein kinase RdoA (MazF antagonist)
MDDDVAPPVRLRSFSPVFPVRDLRRALDHYAALGFEVRPYADGDLYGFADRDGVGLHLSAEDGHPHDDEHAHGGVAYLYVSDADALYEQWARPGVGGLTRRVSDTDYRLREGSHVDPDGNLIRFGSPMPGQPAARLRAHLSAEYGIVGAAMTELDVGVGRAERSDGRDWVARWFPPGRAAAAADGDAEILRYLAQRDFPAERVAAAAPVSSLDGRPVLVTEWAAPVPRERRRQAIQAAGGLRQLGAMLGRLHALPAGTGALARPGGGWHHLADGSPTGEVAAASRMLADAAHRFAGAERDAYQELRAEVSALDAGQGLPEALTHPDFVLANVVATEDGMVVVDWAGTGRGPRAWSLAFLLYAEGAKDLRRASLVLDGYRGHVRLSPGELDRLAGIIVARPLILSAWSVCTGRSTPAEAVAHAAGLRPLAEAIAARARAAYPH